MATSGPQAIAVLQFMLRNNDTITARDAFLDMDMTSATLTRRICDLEEDGYVITRKRKTHRVTRKRFTEYVLDRPAMELNNAA